jgi:hypothetical protein
MRVTPLLYSNRPARPSRGGRRIEQPADRGRIEDSDDYSGKRRRSFAVDGLEGLRDSPRSGRPPRYDSETRHKVQTRVCQQPEDQGRWTVRTLAAEDGLPASTVHAMLVAAKLASTETKWS